MLDSNLTMRLYPKALSKSCLYHIHSFVQIRSFLDDAMAASVALVHGSDEFSYVTALKLM